MDSPLRMRNENTTQELKLPLCLRTTPWSRPHTSI